MSVEVVRVAQWAQYLWLVHGFSTRVGGVSRVYGGRTLNLGWTKEDEAEAVVENRRRFMKAFGIETGGRLATRKQVHGTEIQTIASLDDAPQSAEERSLCEGDGLMTSVPDVLVGILTADCVPVMIVDVRRRAVALLHAGWRGTAASMAVVGVERMREEFGSHIEDLVAAVGPSIGPCCYVVGEEVRLAFGTRFAYGEELFTGDRLNLWAANQRQLVDAGVAAEQVTVAGECTACARGTNGERQYFSYRAEEGVTGRMMSVVGTRVA